VPSIAALLSGGEPACMRRQLAPHNRVARRTVQRFLRQTDQNHIVKAGPQSLQPACSHPPIRIAARTAKQIKLRRQTADEACAQLCPQHGIISGCCGNRRIKGSCFIDHRKSTCGGTTVNPGFLPRPALCYGWHMTRRKTMLHLDETDATQAEATSALPENIDAAQDEQPYPDAEWEEHPGSPGASRGRVVTALLIITIAVWTGAYLWIHLGEMQAGASGSLWLSWTAEWALPALLLLVIAQLTLRNGTGEQLRFANAASLLSRESGQLENRLVAVNRELSLARDFIASQSRDLESLGRVAAERLNGSAEHIQSLIAHNSEHIERIGQVGDTAIGNMERLRDQLPVLANSARDMTSQIANAGNVAAQQMQSLVEGFERLEQFGNAGERHVEHISARMTETLDLFDQHAGELGGLASDQFAILQRQSEEFRNQLKIQDDEATEAFRQRANNLTSFLQKRNDDLVKVEEVAAQGMRERVQLMIDGNNRMLREMVERRNEASSGVNDMIAALEARLAEAISKVAKIDEIAMGNARTRLAGLAEESDRVEATIGQHSSNFETDLQRRRDAQHQREMEALAALEQRLAEFDSQVSQREEGHLSHVASLAERGEQLSARLSMLDADLERIGSQAATARDHIGQSADQLAERLTNSREILSSNGETLAALSIAGNGLLDVLRANAGLLEGELAESMGRVEARLGSFGDGAGALHEMLSQAEARGAALASHVETAREHGANTLGLLDQLEVQLGELAERSGTVTGQTRQELQSAFDMLSMATANVLQDLRHGHGDAIREIADQIAASSHTAIAGALHEHASASIAEIETSALAASEAGRATVAQLRDQLSIVNQLTGNLEQRVTAARERAEEQVGDDFARRMAIITESLNSGAIDIAKAFDNDVADTQWANYLRGDRGIFTRRAVRLLDKAEARAVHDFYQTDSDFRETVNHYIHDFEAMLRSVLSTRDGNTMAVTLLSSDVGKLYVCLAQAIDRLRD